MEEPMKSKPLEPPVVLFAALALMPLLHFLLPLVRWIRFPWSWLGLLPLSAGIALNLAADTRFTHAHTTVKPQGSPSRLITSGPFRISRHPMYLGMTLLLLGIASFFGTLSPLMVTAAFPLVMEFRFVGMEEKKLAAAFGAEWDAYRRRVRRWI